jgi:hypothetical protein
MAWMMALGLLLLGGAARAQEAKVDYEAGFLRGFPEVSGEHHVVDWQLYSALVGNDVVTYAGKVDQAVGKRIADTRGKPYLTQQLEVDLRRDPRLRAAFEGQRRRLGTMTLYAEADLDESSNERCPRSLVYLGDEFRLVLGERTQREDPLALATVAPSCARQQPGFQLTAAHSPRFRCWSGSSEMTCGWRLPDMPIALKRVVETDYPTSIRLRWRWRGLGAVDHVRLRDDNGNFVAERDRILVTTPVDLGLEFVDGQGRILWTAASGARLSRLAAP